jgi:hypothetical protein
MNGCRCLSSPGRTVKPDMDGLVSFSDRGQAAQDLLFLGVSCLKFFRDIPFSQDICKGRSKTAAGLRAE